MNMSSSSDENRKGPRRSNRLKRNIAETLPVAETSAGCAEEADRRTRRCEDDKKVTDDLICPITLELPFDPVTAEDGRVYEKDAIEQHIQNSFRHILKSPCTNMPMGPNLLRSTQTKSLIQTLIDNGTITNNALVESWNEKVVIQKRKERILQKAETGDAKAMGRAAFCFHYGRHSFKV